MYAAHVNVQDDDNVHGNTECGVKHKREEERERSVCTVHQRPLKA